MTGEIYLAQLFSECVLLAATKKKHLFQTSLLGTVGLTFGKKVIIRMLHHFHQ